MWSGDTLTRSHFYVAILSGCIPVIFGPDNGDGDSDEALTAWAWRSSNDSASLPLKNHPLFINYSAFTVRFDTSGLTARASSKLAALLEELVRMPTSDPRRFQALRSGLESAAPLMRYSMEDCDGAACTDATSHLVDLLGQYQVSVNSIIDKSCRTDS